MTRAIYRKGRQITDVVQVVRLIEAGHWLFIRDKAFSPKWTAHHSIALLRQYANGGVVRLAVRRDGRSQIPATKGKRNE